MTGTTRSAGASGKYVSLFTIRFQHDYYNASGGNCPDFNVSPTPDCARLMVSLGMIFRDFGAGFGVAIDETRIPAMIAYLVSHYRTGGPGSGYWTWLSFQMTSTNPDFVGITQIPITTNPMLQNLYASNLTASMVKGELVLGGASGKKTGFCPITGASLTVPTPEGMSTTLHDISGAAVPVRSSTNGAETSFTMKGLPFGRYTAGASKSSTVSTAQAKRLAATRSNSIYAPGKPIAFGLIDLLLTQPAPGQGEATAFPVPPMPPPQSGLATARPSGSGTPMSQPAVTSVTLTLPFQARKTYWKYYICSHDRTARFASDLGITGSGTRFTKSQEQLPNGDAAVLFSAKSALPLHQISPYRFQLSGHRQGGNGGRDTISVPWLPAAAPSPVWPAASGNALNGSSEIYVYV